MFHKTLSYPVYAEPNSSNTYSNQLKLREEKVAREIKWNLVTFCLSKQYSLFQAPFIQNDGFLFFHFWLNKSDF